jgi:hypothetical protein
LYVEETFINDPASLLAFVSHNKREGKSGWGEPNCGSERMVNPLAGMVVVTVAVQLPSAPTEISYPVGEMGFAARAVDP